MPILRLTKEFGRFSGILETIDNVHARDGTVHMVSLRLKRGVLSPIKRNDKILVLSGSIQGGVKFCKNLYFSYMYLNQWGSFLRLAQFGIWRFSWFLTDSHLNAFDILINVLSVRVYRFLSTESK